MAAKAVTVGDVKLIMASRTFTEILDGWTRIERGEIRHWLAVDAWIRIRPAQSKTGEFTADHDDIVIARYRVYRPVGSGIPTLSS